MRKTKSSKRPPAVKTADSNTSKATVNATTDEVVEETNVSATHELSAAAASVDIDEARANEATSTPVWRSTRLRSGHTNKIDYLKLHNSNTVTAAPGRATPSAVQPPGSHRKRAAGSLGPMDAAAVDKRPRLLAGAAAASAAGQSPGTSASYTCPECSTVLTSSRTFDQHMLANHSGVQAFRCVYCEQQVRTTKALQHHYVRQHRMYAPMPECLQWRLTLQCRACGQSFRTPEHLSRHMDWAHSQCSSIVLMEKLPDDWRWSRDHGSILESADAVEEEYDLAFPGRRLFYDGHPGLLEADMSIRLQPAAQPAAAPAAAPDVDVFAFEDEGTVDTGGDIEIDVVPTPSKDAGPFGSGGRRRRRQQAQQRRRVPAREIDFEQLLRRGDSEDNEIDAESGGEQQQLQRSPPLKPRGQQRGQQRQASQQQQQQPFASETPHYVSSRATVPAPHQSFPCPICMADMATLKSRDRHLLQRHPGVRAFACLECDCTFETYIALRRHVRAQHPLAESGAYKLLIAPGLRRRANQRAAAAASVIAAGNSASAASAAGGSLKPFLCTMCGVSFDLVKQLSTHYAMAHEGRRGGRLQGRTLEAGCSGDADDAELIELEASACTATVASKVPGSLDELKLTCELCSAQFEKITALECHIAADHVDETPYECHLCPAYFPSFGRLRHHQRTVHRVFLQWKEPPQAVLSKLRARSPTPSATVLNLAVPLRRSDMAKVAHQQLRFFDPQSAAGINLESVISGMAPTDTVIFCDFCGDACHNKLELGRHLQCHSGKRLRFGCSKCGQVFEGWNAKSDLVDHMKVDHMGKARYRCSQCEAQFKYSSLLKLHKERGCNSNKPLARPVISYGCSSCDKIFCGEQSAERYRLHTQQCQGQLNRALPSSATVQPPPTAVISGLEGVEGNGGGGGLDVGDEITDGAAEAAGGGGARVVQMTLPGSKEPVSVLIHLEGPVTQEALSQVFVVQQSLAAAEAAVCDGAADDDVEPLQSLADAAAAAAASATSAAAISGLV